MVDSREPYAQGYVAGTQEKGSSDNPHNDPNGLLGEVVDALTFGALKTSDEKAATAWEEGRQAGTTAQKK